LGEGSICSTVNTTFEGRKTKNGSTKIEENKMSDEGQNYNQRNQVQIDLEEYEEKNAQIGALKDEIQKMKDAAGPNKMGWMWLAPEYFSRWRIFPRAFITMYIYLLFTSADWFMALPDPSVAQSGLISVLVGAGAAWFGLYVNSTSTQHDVVEK
tara:strand:- start:23 stop:484 length:462 start_codon:yes stop_codon:yes gene_type:complete